MRLVRSWPRRIPAGRQGVTDTLEKLVIDEFDYTPLGAIDDDVLLLEWDMLALHDELHDFMTACYEHPQRVRVAPYPLFHVDERGPVWCHRRVTSWGDRWIQWQEPYCDFFSFGMTYLPRQLVRAFLA